jgi:RNA polymerase sigma factor (sigma-70 family)
VPTDRPPESFASEPEIYQAYGIHYRGESVAGAERDRDQRELRFRSLYQANYRPVQAYAVNRIGSADDVPDIVAEVFTTAWRRLADIPPPPGDRFWLYGTARRIIARRYRSASRLRNLLGRLAADQYPRLQPLPPAGDPAQERVLAALRELKPSQREALLLVHWEQLTYAEAAETLGCSVNAVGIRVHKAKARLRELLDTQATTDRPVPAIIQRNGATHGS